jgi:glycine/D-amino acid oxidase-like deaminating enzyme
MSLAVVIGGGFYGASIARYLRSHRRLDQVILLEREPELLSRSSFVNQARVHNGYHYPRSFTTGYRSRVNFARFVDAYAPAIRSDFTKLYAIARRNSKVTSRQFERFCREIGAPIAPAPDELRKLFEPALIAGVYLVRESAFDAVELRRLAQAAMAEAGVSVRLGSEVEAVLPGMDAVTVRGRGPSGRFEFVADVAFNCTYSRTGLLAQSTPERLPLKHEITELALIEPPAALKGLGVTVMDGPFFSCMPFPAKGLHSLSHVRYTPHRSWRDEGERDPYEVLAAYEKDSRVDRMLRDGARYLPALAQSRVRESLFEVKTVLHQNELDDGRPILLQRHSPGGRLFSVLGGKIDNIFDILERLDQEVLPVERERAGAWTG